MKRLILFGMLFIATSSFGQIVYKTDYEKATELMGVIYSVSTQDIGEFSYKNTVRGTIGKIKSTLYTFESADTDERVQAFSISFGVGILSRTVLLNCREVDAILNAVNKIIENNRLRYITETANLRIRGSNEKGFENTIAIDLTGDDSLPGDFEFVTQGYISPEEMIKLLESVKALAD